MIPIQEISSGIYEVNGKRVDTRLPKYGKNLKAIEYRALRDYIKALQYENANR